MIKANEWLMHNFDPTVKFDKVMKCCYGRRRGGWNLTLMTHKLWVHQWPCWRLKGPETYGNISWEWNLNSWHIVYMGTYIVLLNMLLVPTPRGRTWTIYVGWVMCGRWAMMGRSICPTTTVTHVHFIARTTWRALTCYCSVCCWTPSRA